MINIVVFSDQSISMVFKKKLLKRKGDTYVKLIIYDDFSSSKYDFASGFISLLFEVLSLTDVFITSFPTYVSIILAKSHFEFPIFSSDVMGRFSTLRLI